MFQLTKQSLISFSILIVLSFATGWFLMWETKETNKQSETMVNEAIQQSEEMIKKLQEKNKQETLDLSIDTSNWKTYRNEEYGFEMKVPEDYTIITQPGSNEKLGFIFVVQTIEYDQIKNNMSNPLISLMDIKSKGVEIMWNRNSWITQTSSNLLEIAQKVKIGDTEYVTYVGEEHKQTLPLLKLERIKNKKLVKYKFALTNVKNPVTVSEQDGFLWKENGVLMEAKFITIPVEETDSIFRNIIALFRII